MGNTNPTSGRRERVGTNEATLPGMRPRGYSTSVDDECPVQVNRVGCRRLAHWVYR
jgi:hypothetical protein